MINSISVTELKRLGPNINLIDIRSMAKYNDNHIMKAINIPQDTLTMYYYKYLRKDTIYYIYCEHGHNSIRVCSLLNSLGYKVYSLIGGYENWILNS